MPGQSKARLKMNLMRQVMNEVHPSGTYLEHHTENSNGVGTRVYRLSDNPRFKVAVTVAVYEADNPEERR